tara:strand:+ start:27470 stop:28822 length:1353 start_codon:yes stop_codon:yes gene_type:complete
MEVVRCHKQIYDNIHGYIHISNIACEIIDTIPFQRLRSLHQLGTCHYVFPTAVHSRFEHSLGTYYLAGRLLNCIKKRTNPREMDSYLKKISYLQSYFKKHYNSSLYELDDYIIELVKIAALCHDLGHGPFSHVFDDVFLQNISDENPLKYHENRSSMLIQYIINNSSNLNKIISQEHIDFVKSLINPKKEDVGFLYQIVSNYSNGIDVDKCDYIARDTKSIGLQYSFDFTRIVDDVEIIDNEICYPKQIAYELACLFTTRYRLHKQVYRHKVTIATQFMINEIMELLDPIINMSISLDDPEKFSSFTDSYIFSVIDALLLYPEKLSSSNLKRVKRAYNIRKRILKRELYEYIDSVISNDMINIDLSKLELSHENIIKYHSKIGIGSKEDPLSKIWFYSKKDPSTKFRIKKLDISRVLPDLQEEWVWMVFFENENLDDKKLIKDYLKDYKN